MNVGLNSLNSPQSLSDSGFSSLSDISPPLGSRKNSDQNIDKNADHADEVESIDSVKSDIDNLQKKLQDNLDDLFKDKINLPQSDLKEKESSKIVLTSLSSPESILDSPSNVYRIVKRMDIEELAEEHHEEEMPKIKHEESSESDQEEEGIQREVVKEITIQSNIPTNYASVTKEIITVETQITTITPAVVEAEKNKVIFPENKSKPIENNKQNFIKKSFYKVVSVIKSIFESIANFFKKFSKNK